METILVISTALYAAFIVTALFGLGKLRRAGLHLKDPKGQHPNHRISIVVPFRNEQGRLKYVLKDLAEQHFDGEFEVIAIDDHSTDRSVGENLKFIESHENFILTQTEATGKKAALIHGIQMASGDIIVTVDADVRINPGWLRALVRSFSSSEVQMLILPVALESGQENTVLTQFQVAENLAIQSIGFGWAAMDMPVSCNGANLAFTKQAFNEVGGYSTHDSMASGDDVLLMKQFLKAGFSVKPAIASELIVHSKAASDLVTFLSQRLRWAGKSRMMTYSGGIIAGFILIFHTGVLLTAPVFSHVSWSLWGGALLLKILLDIVLIKSSEYWYSIRMNPLKLALIGLAYVPYLPIITILSLIWRPKWKGRKI